jgi:hypothetical protein
VGFLGYEPARLRTLVRALDDLADEKTRIASNDAAAASTVASYRQAVALMTGWRSRLVAIVSCGFDADYRPIGVDAADPSLVDVVHPSSAGWTVVTDPLQGACRDVVAHARHLSEFVAAEWAVASTMARAAALADVRATLADASARDAFVRELRPEGLRSVAETLAAPIGSGVGDIATSAAALLSEVARAFGASYRAGALDRTAWEAHLSEVTDTYAAALVLRDANLGAVAARLVPEIWARWTDDPRGGIDAGIVDARTPDVLLEVLNADPSTARAVLEGWPRDRLDQLLGGDVDPALVPAFLLASTDGGTAPAEVVGPSMVAVLSYLEGHKDLARSGGIAAALGAYAGPYLESVVGPSDGAAYPAPAWDWKGRDTVRLVEWMARDRQAGRDIAAWIDAIVPLRTAQLATAAGFVDPALVHLGRIAGGVDRALADARVNETADRVRAWTAAWTLVAARTSSAAAAEVGASATASLGISFAVQQAASAFADAWITQRWPGAPPDIGEIVAQERSLIGARNGDRQGVLVHLAFKSAVAAGAMASADEPPPYTGSDYVAALTVWADADPTPARRRLWGFAVALEDGTCRETEACDGTTHADPGHPTVG